MKRAFENTLLHKAKKNKNDEFYTQSVDIARELECYSPMLFKDKVVYCNCDDPEISNFVQYFVDNFETLGLKKLIASCYRTDTNPNGKAFIYTGTDADKEKLLSKDFTTLSSDGDFRGPECLELLEQSDIVVTNPPFSLFRDFVAIMMEFGKKFLAIGNVNVITYKEIFPLIKDNQVWLGNGLGRAISGFIVPEHYELYGTEQHIDKDGNRIVATNGCLWLTNLDLEKRHEDIKLTKTYYGNEYQYPHYDNFNGINVNKTSDIPADYEGYMGVPITFLHKHNPSQFEIVKFRKGDDGKDLSINGKCPYFRIIIKRNNGESTNNNTSATEESAAKEPKARQGFLW